MYLGDRLAYGKVIDWGEEYIDALSGILLEHGPLSSASNC